MSNILADGTILPSYCTPVSHDKPISTQFSNHPIRVGEIREAIYPTDPRSFYKKAIEYFVAVEHRDGKGLKSTVLYPHCRVSTLFGGIADKFTFTLREPKDKSSALSNGSKVLLLCVNGEQGNAAIIGGAFDDTLGAPETNKGHNLYFEFNGANATVNKDGEVTVTFKGATKPDGTPADGVDTSKNGTYFTMLKDGTFRILSQGVYVGAATDAWMLGTTYRNAENQSNNTVLAQLNAAMAALSLASTALLSASTMMKVPVIGAVSASVPIQAASVAVQQAGTALQSAATAIQSFEAGAPNYLSKKNLTD